MVEPAFEASLEFVRHTLGDYNVDALEVEGTACPFLKRYEGTTISGEQNEGQLVQSLALF